MTTPRTNTIGETLSKHDEHEDCPPVGSAQHTLGPWKAVPYQGYGTHYWTISRVNPNRMGGTEIMLNAQFNPRRFKTEFAANAAIARTTGANQ